MDKLRGILDTHSEEFVSNPWYRRNGTKRPKPLTVPGVNLLPEHITEQGYQSQLTWDQMAVALPQEQGTEGPAHTHQKTIGLPPFQHMVRDVSAQTHKTWTQG